MNADDSRHGSHAGYQKHRADGEEACQPCLRANTRYHKGLMLDYHRGLSRKIPSIGARRRVQALQRLGWSLRAISREAGYEGSTTVLSALIRGDHDSIFRDTHDAIAAAYERLSMRLPTPSSGVARARNAAEKKGYAPPLAWDCIDDPDERPSGFRGHQSKVGRGLDEGRIQRVLAGEVNLPTTKAEKVEILRRWLAAGGSERALCQRMGWRESRYRVRDQEAS